MVEGRLSVHVTQAEVARSLVERRGKRVGVERIRIVLTVARHDWHASEGDADYTVVVAGELSQALRSCRGRGPVEVADLAVEGSLVVDLDHWRVDEGRVEQRLEIDVVDLRNSCRSEAVRRTRVRLHTNVGESLSHGARGTELSLEDALGLRRRRDVDPVVLVSAPLPVSICAASSGTLLLGLHLLLLLVAEGNWRSSEASAAAEAGDSGARDVVGVAGALAIGAGAFEEGSEGLALGKGASFDLGLAGVSIPVGASVATVTKLDSAG